MLAENPTEVRTASGAWFPANEFEESTLPAMGVVRADVSWWVPDNEYEVRADARPSRPGAREETQER